MFQPQARYGFNPPQTRVVVFSTGPGTGKVEESRLKHAVPDPSCKLQLERILNKSQLHSEVNGAKKTFRDYFGRVSMSVFIKIIPIGFYLIVAIVCLVMAF